jgi:hypothetical protein
MRLVVNRWGNSAGIRLPKQVLQKLKIDINDEMDYKIEGEKIILEKVNSVPEFTIEELFRDYEGEPTKEKPIIFRAEGNEKW